MSVGEKEKKKEGKKKSQVSADEAIKYVPSDEERGWRSRRRPEKNNYSMFGMEIKKKKRKFQEL